MIPTPIRREFERTRVMMMMIDCLFELLQLEFDASLLVSLRYFPSLERLTFDLQSDSTSVSVSKRTFKRSSS